MSHEDTLVYRPVYRVKAKNTDENANDNANDNADDNEKESIFAKMNPEEIKGIKEFVPTRTKKGSRSRKTKKQKRKSSSSQKEHAKESKTDRSDKPLLRGVSYHYKMSFEQQHYYNAPPERVVTLSPNTPPNGGRPPRPPPTMPRGPGPRPSGIRPVGSRPGPRPSGPPGLSGARVTSPTVTGGYKTTIRYGYDEMYYPPRTTTSAPPPPIQPPMYPPANNMVPVPSVPPVVPFRTVPNPPTYSRNNTSTGTKRSRTTTSKSWGSDDLCPRHGSAKGCHWGSECTQSHENPNSIQFCQLLLTDEGCHFGNNCWDRHQEFVVFPEFQESSSSPIMDQVPKTPPSRFDARAESNDSNDSDEYHQSNESDESEDGSNALNGENESNDEGADHEELDPLTMDDIDEFEAGLKALDEQNRKYREQQRKEQEQLEHAANSGNSQIPVSNPRDDSNEEDDHENEREDSAQSGDPMPARSVRSFRSARSFRSMRSIGREYFTVAEKIDHGLDHYYRAHGRTDYFNEDGKGKFMEMVEMNQLEEDYDFEQQFGNEMDPNDCIFIHIDDTFPLDREYSSDDEKNRVIFKVLQNCYKHGRIYRMMANAPGIEWERFLDSSHGDYCDPNDIDECTHVMRMIEAVRYYPYVYPVKEDDEAWDDLVVFLNETYGSFLMDYQHIMAVHRGPRHQAFFKRCTRRVQCVEENCLKQHLRELRGSGKAMHHFELDPNENVMTFYQDLMDSMHVLFKHGHDIGIRIKVCKLAEEEDMDESAMQKFADPQFEFKGKIRCRMHTVWVFSTPNCISRNWSAFDDEEDDITDID